MGFLMYSRECGKATAVAVPSFEVDLVAESWKRGSRRLNFAVSCTVAKYIFTAVERAGARMIPVI